MKSKSIILSSENNSNKTGRGILTIYSEEDLLKCRLRLYNIEKLNKYCKLGIYHNKQVYSANLIEKNGVYTSSFVGEFDIDKDFYTAIVNTQLNNEVIIAGGTYAGHFVNEDAIFSNVENSSTKTNLLKPIVDKEEILNCSNNCDNCANCVYKEYFYTHKENVTSKNAEQNNINSTTINIPQITKSENTEHINEFNELNITKSEVNEISIETQNQPNNTNVKVNSLNNQLNSENVTLLQSLSTQFEHAFKTYPENSELNKLIDNSKFVEIKDENNAYSIGAIYEDEKIKYLCYAVKSNYNTPAPEELGKHYQWLPLDKQDPLTDGYYLVFQDAVDLKIIEL